MNGTAIEPIAYLILTSKPGQYRTEAAGKLTPVEAWDYIYCGRLLATFAIAALYGEARVRIVDESGEDTVNDMPIRFLEKFRDRDAALKALHVLVGKRNSDAQLLKRVDTRSA